MLLVWLGLQLAVLAVGAGGVRFSARWPSPAQSLALHEMLIAQIVIGAMLFPWLMRTWRTTIAVVATAWPFIVLASLLAQAPSRAAVLAGGLHVTLWLLTLGLLSNAQLMRSRPRQFIAVAATTLYVIGGACFSYLIREFGTNASSAGKFADADILSFAVAQIHRPFTNPIYWIIEGGALAVVLLLFAWLRSRSETRST